MPSGQSLPILCRLVFVENLIGGVFRRAVHKGLPIGEYLLHLNVDKEVAEAFRAGGSVWSRGIQRHLGACRQSSGQCEHRDQ